MLHIYSAITVREGDAGDVEEAVREGPQLNDGLLPVDRRCCSFA